MMAFEGAVIEEQGVTFGVVVVKPHVLRSGQRDGVVAQMSRTFGGIPTVLMAQDSSGRPTYYGRRDLVRFMANVPLRSVPWRKYTVR